MRHRGGGVGHQRPSYSTENDIVGEVGEEEEADDEFAEIDQDEGEMEDEEEDEYAEEDEDLLNEGEEWDSVWAEDEEEEDLEGEVMTYGYELVDEDEGDDENGGLGDFDLQVGKEALGPEDGEAEDEHDGYCGYYAPL